jgi:hypothetical protein
VKGNNSGSYLLFATVFVCCFLFIAQSASANTWMRTYGGQGVDAFWSMRLTADGNFIVAGHSDSFGGSTDFWVVKVDLAGNILWEKIYGGDGFDFGADIRQTADSGYIVIGDREFADNNQDLQVIKLDATGAIEWQKTYGDTGFDEFHAIRQTSDGGYIVLAATESFGANNVDLWVLKLNVAGDILWQKMYDALNFDFGADIQQTTDGGYIVTAQTSPSDIGKDNDVLVFKLSSTGSIQWKRLYGGNDGDSPLAIRQTTDGGYVVISTTRSFGVQDVDAWILKLDASGNLIWSRTFGATNMERPFSIEQTIDGGFIVVSDSNSFGPNGDVWLLRLNSAGTIVWQKKYGDDVAFESARAVYQLRNRQGYIVAGLAFSFGAGQSDGWLIRTNNNGGVGHQCDFVSKTTVKPNTPFVSVNTVVMTVTDTNDTALPSDISPLDTNALVYQQCGSKHN